jgi:hypothetical protein
MNKFQMSGGIAAPNLLNICVDAGTEGEISGRVYSCYSREPMAFGNVVQLLRYMESFYNRIQFPEAAVLLRSFENVPQKRRETVPEQEVDRACVMGQRGSLATFCVYVQYRQNATWQGVLCWQEQDRDVEFRSALEMIALIDNALLLLKERGQEQAGK